MFLKMSNLTARASKKATISAQASSESEFPLLEGVVADVSDDMGTSPYDVRTMKSGPFCPTFKVPAWVAGIFPKNSK
jgi:hypothetical protein